MATFYPSAIVRLQIRLDEGANNELMKAALQGRPVQGAAAQDTIAATAAGRQAELEEVEEELFLLTRIRSELSQEQFFARKARLEARRGTLQLAITVLEAEVPASLQAADPLDDVIIGDIQPIKLTVERNGYRQADTFEFSINFRDAPFDSRVIRACGVEIVMGAVPPDEFALGVAGATVEGALFSQISRSENDAVVGRTKLFGWMDDWDVEFDPDGGGVVRISGRDMTGLLLDRTLPDGVALDLKRPLATGVKQLLVQFPETEGMSVSFRDVRGNDLGPGPIPDRFRSDVLKARRGRVSKNVRSTGQRMKVWDHLTEVCLSLGVVPLMVGLDLLLTKPATTFAERDPIRMVYGRNILDFSFTRKFGAVTTPTVEVRSYDPEIDKTRWARARLEGELTASGVYPDTPPQPARPSKVQPSGTSTENLFVQELCGITDAKQLEDAARNLFEEIGRHESAGSFTTRDITSFDGAAGDLLDLQHADAVTIEVADPNEPPLQGETPTTTNLQEISQQSVSRRSQYLQNLGWGEDFAEKMAAAQETVGISLSTFFVDTVRLDWSMEEGIDIEVAFKNFYVAREEAGTQVEPQGASASASALAGDRQDATSEELLGASSDNRTLSKKAEQGEVPPDDYAAQGTAADQRQQQAVRQRRQA